MKKIILLLSLFSFIFATPVNAQENHNILGIHIIDESDLADAAKIVNATDEWGYVTIVIRDDERDIIRWQKAFDKMRDLKLTPIIRIATHMQENYWARPNESEAKPWAKFLSSLDWPTDAKNVVLFNEPNHAKEWGGEINPEEFAIVSRRYWEQLKRYDENFTVMAAGFDQAASNSDITMDQADFMQRVFDYDELFFTLFDGLASHSYPNPEFSGSVTDYGRGSIEGFNWELTLLKKYYGRDMPVFITETGWKKNYLLSDAKIIQNYKYAFENVWNTENIKAVTPFVLNYAKYPFDKFSWRNSITNEIVNYFNANNI